MHQRRDGSWRFSHRSENCNAYCRNPGNHGSTTGSTALALLPFLGAGQTHKTGDYQDVVRAGLFYLIGRMRTTDNGGDLQEGTMYAQGLATIALCEAYAMTQDEELMIPAQRAIEFVVYAQDPLGGGWRYAPRQLGDTTSFGWQLMALKSGQMAGFLVRAFNPQPVEGANPPAFTDINGNPNQANINQLAAANITDGCGNNHYCPNEPVTRGQMAAFLHRAGQNAGE